ncbi:deoxyribodipyrimidine photolyase [Nocardioides KLBMP 9356]|uniref:Deoxyribodipyrimidine photolyase n=1 Tax=Nocardioides potassii TaxID=2911371 RepID=A0ABS9H7U1_9ACTN|nr:FAD-binding domain-containing protein [Nocardioides potassii]MCF6376088.1 deoxyribodipyrimidine photolyase [Nocardioides potassii]
MPALAPLPRVDDTDAVVAWVATHLGHLTLEGPDGVRPGGLRGGQAAADLALASLDITGYARSRSVVLPESRRGASRMSPYIRHGLLSLPEMWDAVADAPSGDRRRYRDELLWQEFARHLYAGLGADLAEPLRRHQPRPQVAVDWDDDDEMACTSWLRRELEGEGWLVNQTRMWWSSHWTVRHGRDWREGEDDFFRHLLDGSRAANRLGWQWTVGTATGKPYGFSRWQVEKRAPLLCRSCALRERCPIQGWPEATPGPRVTSYDGAAGEGEGAGEGVIAVPGPGPGEVVTDAAPAAVWLTAESLGEADPALAANPDLPVVFVLDEPLLRRLRLSGKRLVFLAECLADLAARRDVDVRLGRVPDELAGTSVAVTFAPVPGFARHARSVHLAQVHPWPWLERPAGQRLTSYSAWRKGIRR